MAVGHRRRMIKKVFENGIDKLLEHEYLELCLYTVYKRRDTNPLAHALLDKFGSLAGVCNATVKELMTVEGIGPAAAEYIKLIPSISKGYSLHTSVRKKRSYTRAEMGERCAALLNGHTNEVAYVLCFDASNHLLKEVKLEEGSPGTVNINPRKVIEAIANTSTTGIVVCHNHPSGVCVPSQQDFRVTENIKRIVNAIDVELIDHIIAIDGVYVSCVSVL